jgi:hypothetical protein
MKKVILVDYINLDAETSEPTRFEVSEDEVKEMVMLFEMRIVELEDLKKELASKGITEITEELLNSEDGDLQDEIEIAFYNCTSLADREIYRDLDIVWVNGDKYEIDNLLNFDEEKVYEEWNNGNWHYRNIIDNELEIEEIEEEINIEGAIEHLQEMNKVAIGNCNVSELQETLEERGYITEVDSSDRDYLVLVERKILEIPGYSIVKEIEARLLDLEGKEFEDSYRNKIIIKDSEICYKEDDGELTWVNLYGKCGDIESGYDTYLDELKKIIK